MELHGKNFLGFELAASGASAFRAFNPQQAKSIEPPFTEATHEEIDRAAKLATNAAQELRRRDAENIAAFLVAIGDEIVALGDALAERASAETGLDAERLKGERSRTVNQLKMFADLIREGSWVDARIDTPAPDRKPVPKPDVRRMLRSIGPVAVFGASNFPLAFSIAGGDTASALAAGNPVIAKAHPAHPGTSEMVSMAIVRAAEKMHMPEGTFSMVHGRTPEAGLALAGHELIRAVAFTGSQTAGRALYDAAAKRREPIPVFSEMGSVNPMFFLDGALRSGATTLPEATFRSVTLGVGQFCTCPGLIFGVASPAFEEFVQQLTNLFSAAKPGTMLNSAIRNGYVQKFQAAASTDGVSVTRSEQSDAEQRTEGRPGMLTVDAAVWLKNRVLHEEVFGPATIAVRCGSKAELLECSRALEGTLTATVHGQADELAEHSDLLDVLTEKAGRLVFNGFPTGVEVGHAMHHGGPYPATTDPRFTSVGSAAIYRFARPVCYQNFPDAALPPELQNANPRKIWRLIDGRLTKDAL